MVSSNYSYWKINHLFAHIWFQVFLYNLKNSSSDLFGSEMEPEQPQVLQVRVG